MRELGDVSGAAHVIQLAVAPVFLLTAVGAFLGVMANRLGRVIDRARVLETKLETAPHPASQGIRDHLKVLSRRARLINIAITSCTVTALCICAVIAILFFGAYLAIDTTMAVSLIFILSMIILMTGLLCFLQEIFLATLSLRIGSK